MTATEQYIEKLTALKTGEIGLLRTYVGRELNASVAAFDLFSGLWWPLREATSRAPRREVAWLTAKLYAFSPLHQSDGAHLPGQMRRCQPRDQTKIPRFEQCFDDVLRSPLNRIEIGLQWALTVISESQQYLDWVALTDDLSLWHRETTRERWTKQFLAETERDSEC